jgi:UDP-3-O-[3-hydroxymyristoyl] glucosamine N-acyltransferase
MIETPPLSTAPHVYLAGSLAELVGGELTGQGDIEVHGVGDFDQVKTGQITLIGTQHYANRWSDCPAAVALIKRGLNCTEQDGKALIWVDNADLAFSMILAQFTPPPVHTEPGIHPTAIVHGTASLGKDVRVGPYCLIGPGVTLGDGCVLHHRVTILDQTQIGGLCTFWSGVVIRDRCTIGDRCTIHPNTVIGADGFGYRPEVTEDGPRLIKIPQIGTVIIGHDVEIGAGSCIDRAKCNATLIGDGCKIDNLVQIGHNCRLGRMVIVSGCTGIGGSTVIGDGTLIGGHCAISDHLIIGEGAQIAGGAKVITNLCAGVKYAGSPAKPVRETMREAKALRLLPDLLKQLRRR